MNLYEQMEIVKKRPGNYIGDVSLNNLRLFIEGITFSLSCNGIQDEFDIQFNKYFNWYVNYKLLKMNISNESIEELSYNGSRGFVQLIYVIEKNNSKQIEMFFSLLESFYIDFNKKTNFQDIMNKLKNNIVL